MRLHAKEITKVLLSILIILLFAQTLVNFQVSNRARLVRICDESEYLKRGLEVYHILFNSPPGIINRISEMGGLIRLQEQAMDRPPFLFVLQALAWRFLRMFNIWDENAVILTVNTLYLYIMILSCYGIGLFLYSRKVGFMSAILVAFSPVVFESPRRMMTDLPLAAMLCLSVYMLLKTDKFRSRFFSICLGVILAISQLTRETFAFYIIFPLLYFIYLSFNQGSKDKVFYNIMICLGLGIIIAGPVFLNPASFYAYRKYLLFSQVAHSYTHYFYYLFNAPAIMGYIVLFSTLPLCISFVVGIKKVDKILLIWFLMPFLVLSASPNQFLRFIMPIIPAYFLIISHELFKIRFNHALRKFYVALIIFFCLFQYVLINYLPETRNILPNRNRFEVRNVHVYNEYFTVHKHLMEVFRNEKTDGKSNKRVLALFGVPEIFYPLQ